MKASTKVKTKFSALNNAVCNKLLISATSAMKKHRKKKNNAEKELKVKHLEPLNNLMSICNIFQNIYFSAFKRWKRKKNFSTTFAIKALKML